MPREAGSQNYAFRKRGLNLPGLESQPTTKKHITGDLKASLHHLLANAILIGGDVFQ